MILTFKELGVNPAKYNGMSFSHAHGEIINIACNYAMWHHFKGRCEEECIPDPMGGFVNFILQTVEFDTAIPDQQ